MKLVLQSINPVPLRIVTKVPPKGLPTNLEAPALTGSAIEGETLSCSAGTWDDGPNTFAYQWRRGLSDIGGANADSYVLTEADGGQTISCRVTATNTMGSRSQLSNAVTVAALPALFTSSDQRLFVIGAASPITTSKPTALTYDGTALGPTVGNPATFMWTPGALDAAVTLATADGATQERHMVVAANGPQTVSGGGCTYVTGRPDWEGGNTGIDIIPGTGTARRLIDIGAVGRPTSPNSGMQFWISDPMNASLDGFGHFDKDNFRFVEGAWQSGGKGGPVGTMVPVERKQTSDGLWGTRIQFRLEAGKVNDSSWLDLMNALNDTVNVASATVAFRVSGITLVDGIMNMPKTQRINIRDHIVAIDGGSNALVKNRPNTRRLLRFSPHSDGTQLYDSSTGFPVEMAHPTTYDPYRAQGYDAVLIPKVEPFQNSYNGEITGDGANTGATYPNQGLSHNQALIDALDVVVYSFETLEMSWGGMQSDGKFDNLGLIGALLDRLTYMHNLTGRWGAKGYSKAFFACVRAMQAYPQFIKAVAGGAAPSTRDWTYLTTSPHDFLVGVGSEFDTQAAFESYDPFSVANFAARKAPFLGGKKISIFTDDTFSAEHELLKALLDAQGVTYFDRGNLVPGRVHDYYSAWGNQMLEDVVGMMRGTLT